MQIDETKIANDSIADARKFCSDRGWKKGIKTRFYTDILHDWLDYDCYLQRPATTD